MPRSLIQVLVKLRCSKWMWKCEDAAGNCRKDYQEYAGKGTHTKTSQWSRVFEVRTVSWVDGITTRAQDKDTLLSAFVILFIFEIVGLSSFSLRLCKTRKSKWKPDRYTGYSILWRLLGHRNFKKRKETTSSMPAWNVKFPKYSIKCLFFYS